MEKIIHSDTGCTKNQTNNNEEDEDQSSSFFIFFKKIWKCQKNVLSLWCKNNEDDMRTFEITMNELGKDGKVRTITQTAICQNRRQVIEWYGLNNPDIISYSITEKI